MFVYGFALLTSVCVSPGVFNFLQGHCICCSQFKLSHLLRCKFQGLGVWPISVILATREAAEGGSRFEASLSKVRAKTQPEKEIENQSKALTFKTSIACFHSYEGSRNK
jgi:hypothetical protein